MDSIGTGTQLLSVYLVFSPGHPCPRSTVTMLPQPQTPRPLAYLASITLLMLLVPAVSAAGGAEGGRAPPRALLPAFLNAMGGTTPAVSTPATAASATTTPISVCPSPSIDSPSTSDMERLNLLREQPLAGAAVERRRALGCVGTPHRIACLGSPWHCLTYRANHVCQ